MKKSATCLRQSLRMAGLLIFSRVSPDFYNLSLWLLRLGAGYKPLGQGGKVQIGRYDELSAQLGCQMAVSSCSAPEQEPTSGFGGLRYPTARVPRRINLGIVAVPAAISRLGNRLAFDAFQSRPQHLACRLEGAGSKTRPCPSDSLPPRRSNNTQPIHRTDGGSPLCRSDQERTKSGSATATDPRPCS